ncbi:MAG: alpha-galactosidase, partial [Clostridiales bacterium]|nr:alpha-galactosidase [Clostridiales bacterium]
MLENSKLTVTYIANGTEKTASESNADFTVKTSLKSGVYDLFITPSVPITVKRIALTADRTFSEGETFFGNGFQSWTDTKEYSAADTKRDLGTVGKDVSKFQFWQRLMGINGSSFFKKGTPSPMGPVFVNAGDYSFARYEKRKGFFHSLSYTYLRRGDDYTLIGSLNERNGYTVIYADMKANTLTFEKDIEGVTLSGEYHVFSLLTVDGGYDHVFDQYFGKLGAKLRAKRLLKGYTSWYNYYQGISEEIILRDLDALTREAPEINTFQIDDGYQTAVGDWLSIDAKKFPNGMKKIADAIHAKGLKAGLWVAPLGAQIGSKVLTSHPDWFIKGADGKPLVMGPNWTKFCGLNFYLPEVRAHIRHFFDVILNEWGYDLVKLDFLYAAGAVPLDGKSRAECMFDAMD